SKDEDKSAYLNLNYRSKIGGLKADWSVGGMYRDKDRSSQYDNYQLRPSNPSNQSYDGDITHNNFIVFNGEGTEDNALNYDASEKVADAYGMVKLEWGKFLVTGGARYSHTQLKWSSNVPETVGGKTGSITYYDVLPSGDIKYALAPKQALRLSYYSAISRPNFYDVVPHIGGDVDQDYQEKGNPNLKRTTADNFDLRYEYFPRGLDQLLIGVFYKDIRNPIEYSLSNDANSTGTGGTNGTFLYYIPQNWGTAHNYGAELDLTKYWRSFGVKANYTFTNSSIKTTKVENYVSGTQSLQRYPGQTRPLQGQSKHIANLSFLFKDDNKLGLNAQLAFGYTSARIATVSQFLNNDVWQKGFAQMDFSVEKRVVKHWYVYAKINNILNTPYELEIRSPYTGSGVTGAVAHQTLGRNAFVRKDTYGANYLFGVKFKM
ncbi:MAG TPA: TonB-dependent receptor, partial [Puia sp.]